MNCCESLCSSAKRHRVRGLSIVRALGAASILVMGSGQAGAEPMTPRAIADVAAKSVVGITSMTQWNDEISEGSGFFIDSEGTFVTNYHVIEGAFSLVVGLPSGERHTRVSLVYESEEHDLAILRIGAVDTPALQLDFRKELHPGDTVYVMGNPLGQQRSFSNGLVSAWRDYDGVRHFQMTAPISSGSSGGPVMDSQGRVVGVATAYIDGGQNLNLAVPVSYLKTALDRPQPARPFQGTRVQPVAMPRSAEPGRFLGQPLIDMKGDEWEKQVRAQLREIAKEARKEGFLRANEYVSDLNDWTSALIVVPLERGVEYLIGAACDQDCADLDLFVYDNNNRLLAEETEVTDFPLMDFRPRYTGQHFVRVRMAECQGDPCTFGVVVWREK